MAKKQKQKKAPPRLIGNWKQEAIADNPGASDEDLAKIINDKAAGQGYNYTISPEKVRGKAAKEQSKAKAAPARKAPAKMKTEGALVEGLHAVVQLVGKAEATEIVENIITRL
jgi:hypothetical protein